VNFVVGFVMGFAVGAAVGTFLRARREAGWRRSYERLRFDYEQLRRRESRWNEQR
jgi:hypothetical protein